MTRMESAAALPRDPMARIARSRHEFGEHGGVNLSIETSATFTVLEAGKMPEMFEGRDGPRCRRTRRGVRKQGDDR